MWDQPHFRYYADIGDRPDVVHQLVQIEAASPGALVYGRVNGHRRVRLSRLIEAGDAWVEQCEIFAPLHGAWLTERALACTGVTYTASANYTGGITGWSNDEVTRARLVADGQELVEEAVSRGELKSHVIDIATPYQFMGAAWARSRPWAMNVWSCGSGKTLGAIMAALSREGPILVVAPAKARHVWWSQVQEYTNVHPYRMRPKSAQRKNDATLESYLQSCRNSGRRPFVVVGAESLADNLDAVRAIEPTVLILDEIHTHGSRKRWKAFQVADGSVSFDRRKTAASERVGSAISRENRAVATMDVSRMPSVQFRMGLTATPLDDGRPRRLWSQLDLLSPGGFSHSYSRFAQRYCDARPGEFGGMDDKGSSNMDELKARCSFLVHEVPYSESHAALPDTRVQVVYLSASELNRAERWSDGETFGQALRQLNREVRTNPLVRERVVEARLSEACSRKRKYVTDEALEGLKGGGKVVVFTARRRETELWAHAVRREVTRGDEAQGDVPVWVAHGGIPESERDDIIDAFRESPGPCCLVATGQSMGTGVDGMQTADLAIFAMLPWKPGDFVQWKGRFDRLGGNPTLLKVVVAEGTYDTRVVDILVDKFGPIETFLKADELTGLGDKLRGLEDHGAIVDSIVARLSEAS